MPVVIYGPPGSGKTKYKEQLRQKYKCFQVEDEFPIGGSLKEGTLYLTSPRAALSLKGNPNFKLIEITEALKGIA